jgi:chromatin segregation and condensation protein Rec8/ScpA/Scc1 (kleisin family)
MRNITTARVEYRENTSGNGIFIPDFSGNSAQYYLQKWRMIELERDERYESMIENNKVVLSKIEEKIEAVREELNSYQKTRLWKTKKERELVRLLKKFTNESKETKDNIRKIGVRKRSDTKDKYEKILNFLKEEDFVLDSMSVTSTKEGTTRYEIWKHQS